MKIFRVYRIAWVTVFLSIFDLVSVAGDLEKSIFSPLDVLLKEKKLSAIIQGIGGHEGECIIISLHSTSEDTAFLWLEPGRLLQSLDTAVQDILITREEMLVLAPGDKIELKVFGFCSQALNSSPDSLEQFIPGRMADSTLTFLAEFLNDRNNNFPQGAIQNAVWCLTDNYSIGDIYGDDLASINELRGCVAGLKGLDPKDYMLSEEDISDPVSSNSVDVSGEIGMYFSSDCLADFIVVDSEGKEYENLEKQKSCKSGYYNFTFRFTAVDWPPGKYYLIIRSERKILYKKEFAL